jgi:hypothetical protein
VQEAAVLPNSCMRRGPFDLASWQVACLALHDGCLVSLRCAHIALQSTRRAVRTVASGEVLQRLSHAAEEVDHP